MKHAIILSFVLGFTTASPVGPTGLLCLRRTLSKGFLTGFLSALGISGAYAFWSYVTIYGLINISHWIEQEKIILQAFIGIFFLIYGLRGILKKPEKLCPAPQLASGISEFLSTFLVVFLNPGTFLMFSVTFTFLGLSKNRFNAFESFEIASSVFMGAIIFWTVVLQFINKIRIHMTEIVYCFVARLSACAIIIFGLIILTHCLYCHLHG